VHLLVELLLAEATIRPKAEGAGALPAKVIFAKHARRSRRQDRRPEVQVNFAKHAKVLFLLEHQANIALSQSSISDHKSSIPRLLTPNHRSRLPNLDYRIPNSRLPNIAFPNPQSAISIPQSKIRYSSINNQQSSIHHLPLDNYRTLVL
jgi:hypothetical protein